MSKRNRSLTAPDLAAKFNRGRDKTISVSKIKRRLQKGILHDRIATKKPLLRHGNKAK